jgi:hypothetical protein
VDEMLEIVKTFAPDLELKYNKFYIGLAKDGQPNNFVIFRARKNSFHAEIRLPSWPDFNDAADVHEGLSAERQYFQGQRTDVSGTVG